MSTRVFLNAVAENISYIFTITKVDLNIKNTTKGYVYGVTGREKLKNTKVIFFKLPGEKNWALGPPLV